MSDALYDRLGGEPGSSKLVDRIIDFHLANSVVGTRFTHSNVERGRAMASSSLRNRVGPSSTRESRCSTPTLV